MDRRCALDKAIFRALVRPPEMARVEKSTNERIVGGDKVECATIARLSITVQLQRRDKSNGVCLNQARNVPVVRFT